MQILRNDTYPHLAVNQQMDMQLCDNCSLIGSIQPNEDFEAQVRGFIDKHKECPPRETAFTLNDLLG